ncbi:hypothetical protein ACFWHW_01210 [Streptomyces pharetrae]|uniref:hypothetical protein n=1 Tax=Streptomyces pharetrae TaxID=291370 RepID=UPI0036592478
MPIQPFRLQRWRPCWPAAAVETEHSALEAELHAILELASTGHVTVGHVAQLREIDPGKLPPELAAYVVDLLEG